MNEHAIFQSTHTYRFLTTFFPSFCGYLVKRTMSSEHTPSDDTSSTSGDAGTNDPKRLQNVFRVTLQPKKEISGFHPRRAHKKSRAGCSTCKKRRVKVRSITKHISASVAKVSKCDEQRPECLNCQKRGITCCYTSEEIVRSDTDSLNRKLSKEVPTSTLFSLSLDNVTKDIQETLSLDINWKCAALRNQNSIYSMGTVAFHNFVRCSTATIVSPAIRNVMRTDMVQVSFSVSVP